MRSRSRRSQVPGLNYFHRLGIFPFTVDAFISLRSVISVRIIAEHAKLKSPSKKSLPGRHVVASQKTIMTSAGFFWAALYSRSVRWLMRICNFTAGKLRLEITTTGSRPRFKMVCVPIDLRSS